MIKTDFIKLYEKLNSITEGINDIDLSELARAEKEVKRLEQELKKLDSEVDSRFSTVLDADEKYKQVSAKLDELNSQLWALERTYKGREWYRIGIDDWDHEDWFDREAYEAVKDRVTALQADIDDLHKQLYSKGGIHSTVYQQFAAKDDLAITRRAKRAERDQHHSTATELRTRLLNSYAEVEAEVMAAANTLGLLVDGESDVADDTYVKSSITPQVYFDHSISPDRALVRVDFNVSSEYEFYEGDFNTDEDDDEILTD